MADWREIEKTLVDVFRRLGMRPKMCADYPYTARANGEWFVKPHPELNISELARLISDEQ